MRELLYKIEWPSIRRLRIGILCTYWHFVRALPYSVIELTQSPWDLGSRIDTETFIITNTTTLYMYLVYFYQRYFSKSSQDDVTDAPIFQ